MPDGARAEQVAAIFDREIADMQKDYEPSGRIEWLERLRDEVLDVLR